MLRHIGKSESLSLYLFFALLTVLAGICAVVPLVYGLSLLFIEFSVYHSYTGLGIIFAPPLILVGGVLLFCFTKLIRILQPSGLFRRRILIAISAVIVIGVVLFMTSNIVKQESEREKYDVQVNARHQQILDRFVDNEYVSVFVMTTYVENLSKQGIDAANDEQKKEIDRRRAIIVENVIKPLEPHDIKQYTFTSRSGRVGVNSISFTASVTKEGYEKLRQNKSYVSWVTLRSPSSID